MAAYFVCIYVSVYRQVVNILTVDLKLNESTQQFHMLDTDIKCISLPRLDVVLYGYKSDGFILLSVRIHNHQRIAYTCVCVHEYIEQLFSHTLAQFSGQYRYKVSVRPRFILHRGNVCIVFVYVCVCVTVSRIKCVLSCCVNYDDAPCTVRGVRCTTYSICKCP